MAEMDKEANKRGRTKDKNQVLVACETYSKQPTIIFLA
jgi:hypothetical protein